MRVLILTGKFGMGHWSASLSLRQELLRAFPGAQAEVVDLIAHIYPNTWEARYRWFNILVTQGSGLFNLYYKLTQDLPAQDWGPFEEQELERLGELLDDRRPDAVIATHPICARMVSRWKGETGSALPLITCVTDLSSHSEWIHKYTDCYLVGSNGVRDKLAAKGVDRRKIRVTGIPVRLEFKAPARRQAGGRRRLLVMGGGLGLMPRKDSFYQELNDLPDTDTTIITGRNQKLYDRLAGKYPHIEVVGFTDRVYEYMAGADLVLTKPGGITVFESIFSELPILAWEPFLEQEKLNARFLVKRGLGRVAAKEPEECLAAIRALLYDDGALETIRANMRAMKARLEEESLAHIFSDLAAKEARAG